MWYVYILECRNKALYTGITDNIERRLREHNSGKGGKYTAVWRPVTLLYNETYRNKSDALKREIQLKRWTRAKKLALVRGNHKKLRNFSRRRKCH